MKFAWPELTPLERSLVDRGHSRPYLLDWDRDGHTDLILTDPQSWTLRVGKGPLDRTAVVMVPAVPLPAVPAAFAYHLDFADWDGDGRLDVLVAACRLKTPAGPWLWDVYWLRNTSARGDPTFAAPAHLVAVPEPWEVNGLAVVPHDRPGHQGLVVSVTRDWKRQPDIGWTVTSQLWQYRR